MVQRSSGVCPKALLTRYTVNITCIYSYLTILAPTPGEKPRYGSLPPLEQRVRARNKAKRYSTIRILTSKPTCLSLKKADQSVFLYKTRHLKKQVFGTTIALLEGYIRL